jgi:hypothetical protein
MSIIKVLLRKDAASVIIAIVLGLVVTQFVSVIADSVIQVLSGWIGSSSAFQYDWRLYLFDPMILLALQIIVLELLARVTIVFRQLVINAKAK